MPPSHEITETSLARASATSITVATVAVIPLFLVGALSVQVAHDLDISPSALGAVSAAFFSSAALLSPFVGVATARFGVRNVMRFAIALVCMVLLLIGLAANSLPFLLILLAAGGAGNALAQLTINLYVAQATHPARQGTAYGIKQSAIPVAGLLAGLAVPTLGLTIGWRLTFILFAIPVAYLVIFTPSTDVIRATGSDSVGTSRLSRGILRLIALGSGLGAASGSCLTIFLVPGAVSAGLNEKQGGLVFAGACAIGIVSRLISGVRADHRGSRHMEAGALMLAVGAIGFLIMAMELPYAFPFGAAVAFGLGWGWPGLLIFATLQRCSAHPAEGSGYVQLGGSLGCVFGPLVFGQLVGHFSYATAWLAASAALFMAAGCLIAARASSDITS